MSKTTKIVMTVYLYTVSLISLIFFAVGMGNLINTSLKATVFQDAEKRDYTMCNNQPYYSTIDAKAIKEAGGITLEEQNKLDNMISDYDNWKNMNTGEACYKAERQKRLLDSITMILISFPIYLIHWKMARKERQEVES